MQMQIRKKKDFAIVSSLETCVCAKYVYFTKQELLIWPFVQ